MKYKEIFEKIKSNPKVTISEQAIRNAITKIRKDNPGVTLKAAAHIFSNSRGFSVYRNLDKDDVNSLKNYETRGKIKIITKSSIKKIVHRIENIETNLLPSNLSENATKMAREVYPLIYVLENLLRNFISSKLSKKHGNDWWNKKVSSGIKREVDGRKRSEGKNRWHSKRGEHDIFYTDFGDLKNIIINNWQDFRDIFPRVEWVSNKLDEIEMSRNIIAHNNLLPDREIKRLRLYFDDFRKQIGSVRGS